VADDHGIMRERLSTLIEQQRGVAAVESAGLCAAPVSAATPLKRDVILVDLVLGDADGNDATRRVVDDALGAELVRAILAVMSGEQFSGPGIAPSLADETFDSAARNPLQTLSARERQVLDRIAAGASSADIAAHLSLSRKTVDTYRSRLMTKLGVFNRAALLRIAIEHDHGAVSP
jgi:DNA-binding NarL/FixJ family response regulator